MRVDLLGYGPSMSRIFVFLFRVGARANAEIIRDAIATGLNVVFQLLDLQSIGFDREAAAVLLGVRVLLANAGANFYRLVLIKPPEPRSPAARLPMGSATRVRLHGTAPPLA